MTILDKITLQIAEKLREKATKQGRIPFKTGDLRKSIQVFHTLSTPVESEAKVGSNLVYARAVHDGRKAITIYPNVKKNPPRGYRKHKDKKRARLKFTIAGKTIFAKKVHLKATRGQPFLREATEELDREGFGFLKKNALKELSEHVADSLVKKIKVKLG